MKYFSHILYFFCLTACITDTDKTIKQPQELTQKKSNDIIVKTDTPFVLSTWVIIKEAFDKEKWHNKLLFYDSLGISEILVQSDPDFLRKLLPVANAINIKVHAWMRALNQPGNKETRKHPEWYSVNRLGKNSLEQRPYVKYYQWLSPFHPDACEYIKNKVRSYCKLEGLASIHLDYIRYVDVILGAELQNKYKITQKSELPQYDFGYHPIARREFKKLFGIDPIELQYPELNSEWKQFRLNAITELVNEISVIVKQNDIALSAAVFPYPEISRKMVRQAWDEWNLDAAYPMLYHNFYRKNITWIGFATEQGVRAVDFPIHAGLFSTALQDSDELEKAIRITKEKGAAGICIFTADALTGKQKKVLMKLKGSL